MLGHAAHNAILTILFSSGVVFALAYALGRAIGAVAQVAIDEHLEHHRHPAPRPSSSNPGEQTTRPDSTASTLARS